MDARRGLWFLAALLLIADCFILVAVVGREDRLIVTFLDVGQGDAILIESPSGATMLVDGGRDRSVLRELGRHMDVLDRNIEVVVATHPDADHIGGLPDVFERYDVGAYLSPGVENDTSETKALDAAAEGEGSPIVLARRGMRIDMGGGTYADILFPDRDVSGLETNTASVIMRVSYGKTAVLLTGDAPEAVEEYVVSLGGETLRSTALKAGHHGSRTSTGEALLRAAGPSLVVVSAGKDNSYGHPHEEVLARIRESGADLYSTMGEGAVVLTLDGERVTVR